jgi:hypothetical protein
MSGIVRRREVEQFADCMEQALARNDDKGGWKHETPNYLLARLCDEVAELCCEFQGASSDAAAWLTIANHELVSAAAALRRCGHSLVLREAVPRGRISAEAADVANFAMMIADVSESDGGAQ